MFENNAEIDFGEEFTVDFKKPTKRKVEEPQRLEPPKKQSLPVNIVKRKFPGPAGILPETEINEKPNEIPCTQMSISIFQTPPWTNVVTDHEKLVNSYNIAWLKDKATLNKLPNKKVPFLAVYIKNKDCYEGKEQISRVTLKDLTGEIQGTILQSIHEEYLIPGSVILLRECSVLTSQSNNHYLTILPQNIVKIYCNNNRIVKVQDCDLEEKIIVRDSEEEEAWKEALDGIDINSLFGDF